MAQAEFQILDTKYDFAGGKQYVPVELEFIELDSICKFDIYLKVSGRFVLYRASQLPFRLEDKIRLQVAKTTHVYICVSSERELRMFYESNLTNIIDNKKIDNTKKAKVLYQCAIGIAHDIFDQPQNQETISRSKGIVENTIRLLGRGSDAFIQMISLSGHDYYTYTHCVNVLTFTVSLLSAMGFKDQKYLKEAGMGALLHDVGKSKVPLDVLNKPGRLTEDEWMIMKKHPIFGAEIVEKARIPDRGVDIIVQHHERVNGRGYPYGLGAGNIPIASQVVSLVDAYDAMTTDRVYQKAISPFEALRIITQEMKDHYEPQMVETFIKMLNLKKRP